MTNLGFQVQAIILDVFEKEVVEQNFTFQTTETSEEDAVTETFRTVTNYVFIEVHSIIYVSFRIQN